MELKDLKLFVEVAAAAGFRRAAAHLDVRQSVVSRRVRDLEDELGVSLFERHRGGVRLTHAGTRFLSDLRPLLAHLESAVAAVRANGYAGQGRLRLGVGTSLSAGFIRVLLEAWSAEHPQVLVDIYEAGPREQLGSILNRDIDVTFLTGSSWPPGCDAELLWTDEVFAALQANDSDQGELLDLRSLASKRFIVTRGGFGPEISDFIVKRVADLGVSPSVEFVDVGREMVMTMVGLGFGVTLVTGMHTGVVYPRVVYVRVAGEELPFSAVWSPENDNPALRRFLSLARVLAKKYRRDAPSRTLDRLP